MSHFGGAILSVLMTGHHILIPMIPTFYNELFVCFLVYLMILFQPCRLCSIDWKEMYKQWMKQD